MARGASGNMEMSEEEDANEERLALLGDKIVDDVAEADRKKQLDPYSWGNVAIIARCARPAFTS